MPQGLHKYHTSPKYFFLLFQRFAYELAQSQMKDKGNTTADERLGEKDKNLTKEEKSMRRFALERHVC